MYRWRDTGASAPTETNPSALFEGGEQGAWIDPSDLSTLFQDTTGKIPVTAEGQSIALAVDKSKGSDPATMYRGLTGAFDYFVDGTNGNDSNDGTTLETAWKTLIKITGTVVNVSRSTPIRVLIKAGVYDDTEQLNHIYIYFVPAGSLPNPGTEIVFEPDCEMIGNATTTYPGVSISINIGYPVTVYGNGLAVHNFYDASNSTSVDGMDTYDKAIINIYDVHIYHCNDGVSAHNDSKIYLYDSVIEDARNDAINTVNNTYFYASRCKFIGTSNVAPNLLINIADPATALFEDCIFEPYANDMYIDACNTVFRRCQVGTLTKNFLLYAVTPKGPTFYDSFVNIYGQGHAFGTLRRCFGKVTVRAWPGGGPDIQYCIIKAPASSQTAIFYTAALSSGDGSTITFNNNIILAASSAEFQSVGGSFAQALIDNGATFYNNLLPIGVIIDADITSRDTGHTCVAGNINGNALCGAANTLLMTDYAYQSGSPAIGAGVNGTNIGFGTSEVVALAPKQVRGPSGLPGNHASQSTSGNRPTLKISGIGDNAVYSFSFGSGKSLDITFSESIGSDCTIMRGIPGNEPESNIGQSVSSISDNTDHSGLVAVNRALTATETAGLKVYLKKKSRS